MTETRCEPPGADWGVPGFYWLKHKRKGEPFVAVWSHDDWDGTIIPTWTFDSEVHTSLSAYRAGYRYLSPALTPAEVAALRAEVARLRGALEAVLLAPIPPGKHTTTGGVVFVDMIAFAKIRAALEPQP